MNNLYIFSDSLMESNILIRKYKKEYNFVLVSNVFSIYNTNQNEIEFRNKVLFEENITCLFLISYKSLIYYLTLIVELIGINRKIILLFYDKGKKDNLFNSINQKINNSSAKEIIDNTQIHKFINNKLCMGDKTIISFIKDKYNINILTKEINEKLKNMDFDYKKMKLYEEINNKCKKIEKNFNINNDINIKKNIYIVLAFVFIILFKISFYMPFSIIMILIPFVYFFIINYLNESNIILYFKFNYYNIDILLNRRIEINILNKKYILSIINILIPSFIKFIFLFKFLQLYFNNYNSCLIIFSFLVISYAIYFFSMYFSKEYIKTFEIIKVYSIKKINFFRLLKYTFLNFFKIFLNCIKETWLIILLYMLFAYYDVEISKKWFLIIFTLNYFEFFRIIKFYRILKKENIKNLKIIIIFIILILLLILF